MRELLEKLVGIPSVPGSEEQMSEFIKNELCGVFDEIKTDALGNLICHKIGSGTKRVFMTHMDCEGFISTYSDGDSVKVAPLGNIKAQYAAYRRITFETGENALLIPPASYNSDTRISDFSAVLGEAPEKEILPGTKAYFDDSVVSLSGDFISAGTLSSRLGVACLIKAAKTAEFSDADVYFIFTVQERLGGRGASGALYNIGANELYNVRAAGLAKQSNKQKAGVGSGLALNIMGKGFTSDSDLVERICEVCMQNSIDCTRFSEADNISDAMTACKSNLGCKVVEICIPVDNIASPAELVKLSDAQCVMKAISALLLSE